MVYYSIYFTVLCIYNVYSNSNKFRHSERELIATINTFETTALFPLQLYLIDKHVIKFAILIKNYSGHNTLLNNCGKVVNIVPVYTKI